jgi:hypothetical protein
MTGWMKENRVDLFFFKKKGAASRCPLLFKSLFAPAVARRGNLYIVADPGNSACNLIEILLSPATEREHYTTVKVLR